MNATQADLILAFMVQGNRITPLVALNKFGCFRLGARIWEIKKRIPRGFELITERVGVGTYGKSVAEYRLEKVKA